MGYLRQVHSVPPDVEFETSCVGVYERELDYLFTTLQRLGASPREIEDLSHEVYLILHRNWPTLDLTRPIRPYLVAVAFRVVSTHRRKRRREVPQAFIETEDPAIGAEELLQSRQSGHLLMAALDTVPLARRTIIVMHDLDGFPVVEIAAKLSLTRFGVYARLRKARKELASALRRLLKEGASR